MTVRRPILLALALLLTVTAGGGRPAAAAAETAEVAPLLQTTVNDLGKLPLAITVSRVVFTPGASDDAESLPGLRLVLVESGALTLSSNVTIDVSHVAAALGIAPTATAVATATPTPTPEGSSTPDQFLVPGDAMPVPMWTMHSLRNGGTVPAVILDVRITSGGASYPSVTLDAETLATETGLTSLPSGPAAVSLGRGTVAAGASVAAPAKGAYQLVAAASGGGDRLDPQPDGAVRNTGGAAVDVYVLAIGAAVAAVPTPPTQPATGPGGAEVAFDRVVATQHGTDSGGFWIFEPTSPSPGTTGATKPLPIVLFIAGNCCEENGVDIGPNPYRAWIDHIVQGGAVVIEPIFRPKTAMDDVVTGVRAALAELKRGNHPLTDPARFAAFGHSYGSVLVVNYAAVAAKEGLPVPIALMPTTPGCGCLLDDLSAIPASTRLAVVVGGQDDFTGEGDAKQIWAELPQIPADRKDYVRLMGDDHGRPALVADHKLPATSDWGTLDALDWYGTWKLFDALTACAFDGQGCATNFGDTPAERFMGLWSDGVPMREAQVTDDPGPPPPPATPTA
jgi:hypothetical protein